MEEFQTCIGCQGGELITDYSSGDVVCMNCGIVQPDKVIDTGKDWRDFENTDEISEKAHAEIVDEEIGGLGTEISNFTYTGSFSTVSKTLSKYSQWVSSQNKSESYLKSVFARMNELCDILKFPSCVKHTAKDIIKVFERKRESKMKGFKKDSFLLATLLIASKQERGGFSLKELSRATNTDEKEIKRYYKILLRGNYVSMLGIEQKRKSTQDEVLELVGQFCARLQHPFSFEKAAKEIAMKSVEFLEGKQPSSIAAASILFVWSLSENSNKNQRKLAGVASISTNTLRNVYKEICQHSNQLPTHVFNVNSVTKIVKK